MKVIKILMNVLLEYCDLANFIGGTTGGIQRHSEASGHLTPPELLLHHILDLPWDYIYWRTYVWPSHQGCESGAEESIV